jgi:two-component system, OmpR family, sensor histidine kinase KdpD
MTGRQALVRAWMGSFLCLTAVTLVLLALRARLDKAHTTLVYLLVVLAGSVWGGRSLGLAVAGCAFLLLTWFFLPPYNALIISNQLDWLILGAFLIVSVVAAQLLHRERRRADEARQRADEVDRLATLGAEALNVARADEALTAITTVIRTTLGIEQCWIHDAPGGDGDKSRADPLVAWAAQSGQTVRTRGDGTTGLVDPGEQPLELSLGTEGTVRRLLVPLRVRDRVVGVLELGDEDLTRLNPGQRRFLTALAYYAALATERVRLTAEAGRAEALRETDRLKDALIASVSHDLRTPLTTIKALAHDLGASGDERAATIEAEADRLNRLVADLLDLSRLQAGGVPVHLELTAVDDLVGALMQRVSGALQGQELRVNVEGDSLLVGRFDLVHALRILVNLVENAHKYSPRGSPIELGVRRENGTLAFAVGDRGAGVAADQRERIFEPFYRAPGSPPDVGGAGLGLTIARRLAEAQQGSLTLEPRPAGGSLFTLRLPAADIADAALDLL